jgi:hypothetical protein
MSACQNPEFAALSGSLTLIEMTELRAISGHAILTPTDYQQGNEMTAVLKRIARGRGEEADPDSVGPDKAGSPKRALSTCIPHICAIAEVLHPSGASLYSNPEPKIRSGVLHLAMRLAPTPPATVNAPPATSSPANGARA